MIYDVLIVGAGVTGGMLARELSKYRLDICLLEKENDVSCGSIQGEQRDHSRWV